jgi:hypothetical protein
MDSGEVTCPLCGHTQWGTIGMTGVVGLGLLTALWWNLEEGVCTAIAMIVGGICLIVAISWIVKALR